MSLALREVYAQFLKEMIIQPGIAKANLGLSREDVTLEDHVSHSAVPLSPVRETFKTHGGWDYCVVCHLMVTLLD